MTEIQVATNADCAELEKEISELRRQLAIRDAATIEAEKTYEERLNSALQVAFGFAMAKAGIDMLVVDPEKMYRAFSSKTVTVTPAKGGKVRYRLLKTGK